MPSRPGSAAPGGRYQASEAGSTDAHRTLQDLEIEAVKDVGAARITRGNAVAKMQKRHFAALQRELHLQREQIEHLRHENDRMRATVRDAYANKGAGGQSEQDARAAKMNAVMSVKMQLEEQVKESLEESDLLRKKKKELAHEIHEYEMVKKGGPVNQAQTVRRHEQSICHYVQGYNETLNGNKELRKEIDALRHDKLNVYKTYADKEEKLQAYTETMCQLIHIANDCFREKADCRLMYSELISQAGSESEEHRVTIAELINRSEYFDQLMAEKEEDFKKSLQDAERQANSMDNAAEELKEAERKKKMQLVGVFDHLMHSFGVWDVSQLMQKFLAKEEKFFVQYRYLDALNSDATHIQDRIKKINQRAADLQVAAPVDDDEVLRLKEKISEAEEEAEDYEARTLEAAEVLMDITRVLKRIHMRTEKSRLLREFRPARRRWELVRQNLKLIKGMSQKKDGLLARSTHEHRVSGDQRQTYDPRRKTLKEETQDLDEIGPIAAKSIKELGVLEQATLRLISAMRIQEKKTRKRRANALKMNSALILRALNYARTDIGETENKGGLLSGPKYPVQRHEGRVDMLVIPTLKDIDSPRSADGALSPREITEQVAEHGFSDRVSDKFRKALVARMPVPVVKPKGLNVAELALQAVRDAKAEKERKLEVKRASAMAGGLKHRRKSGHEEGGARTSTHGKDDGRESPVSPHGKSGKKGGAKGGKKKGSEAAGGADGARGTTAKAGAASHAPAATTGATPRSLVQGASGSDGLKSMLRASILSGGPHSQTVGSRRESGAGRRGSMEALGSMGPGDRAHGMQKRASILGDAPAKPAEATAMMI